MIFKLTINENYSKLQCFLLCLRVIEEQRDSVLVEKFWNQAKLISRQVSAIYYLHFLICCCCCSVSKSCLTLCDPMDLHYLLRTFMPSHFSHVRLFVTVWTVAQLRDQTCKDWTSISLCLLHWQANSLPLVPPGKLNCLLKCAQIHVYW